MRAGLVLALFFLTCEPGIADPAERYLCQLVPGPHARVHVYAVHGSMQNRIGPQFSYPRRARMASAADIDADGRIELLVLVYKSTRYDRKPAWRPFVYSLTDGIWAAKWLGSRVGRPLLEAAFVSTPKGYRLLTLERCGHGRTVLTLYHWTGFGFWGEWTGEPTPSASRLRVEPGGRDGADQVSVSVGGRRRFYGFRDGGYAPVATIRRGKRK